MILCRRRLYFERGWCFVQIPMRWRRRRHVVTDDGDDASTVPCRRGPAGRHAQRHVTLTSRGPLVSVMSCVNLRTAVARVPDDFVDVVDVAGLHTVVRTPDHREPIGCDARDANWVGKMSTEFRGSVRGNVWLHMQDYKCLREAVMIFATLVNTMIHARLPDISYSNIFVPRRFVP